MITLNSLSNPKGHQLCMPHTDDLQDMKDLTARLETRS